MRKKLRGGISDNSVMKAETVVWAHLGGVTELVAGVVGSAGYNASMTLGVPPWPTDRHDGYEHCSKACGPPAGADRRVRSGWTDRTCPTVGGACSCLRSTRPI